MHTDNLENEETYASYSTAGLHLAMQNLTMELERRNLHHSPPARSQPPDSIRRRVEAPENTLAAAWHAAPSVTAPPPDAPAQTAADPARGPDPALPTSQLGAWYLDAAGTHRVSVTGLSIAPAVADDPSGPATPFSVNLPWSFASSEIRCFGRAIFIPIR